MELLVAPDSLLVEILAQGSEPNCRIRLTLPDGSTHWGELNPAALFDQITQLNLERHPADITRQKWGQVLFRALFPDLLSAQFLAVLHASGQRGVRFRLQIDPDLPHLQRIPWERAAYPQGEDWIPLSPSPMVLFSRQNAASHPWGLSAASGALRMLVIISSPFPENHPLFVNPAVEQENLLSSLKDLKHRLEVEVFSGAVTIQQIAQKLNSGSYDLIHYIGHGEWRESENTAYLLLTTVYPDGSLGPGGIPAGEINSILHTQPVKPALVFLAACESARQSSLDAFSSIAAQFVRNGCPAVVCMQEKVETALLRAFTFDFYRTLSSSGSVDFAVNRARLNLLDSPYFQWAVPVLLMNLADGFLFDVGQRFQPAQRRPFKYLAPYQIGDSDLFKGRTEEILAVENSIREHPLTIIYAEAGVGLTSLLQAGVSPRLSKENWLVSRISSYSNLADQFRQSYPVSRQLKTIIVRGDAPLDEVLRAIDPLRYPKILLILDQFEQTGSLSEEQFNRLGAEIQLCLERLGERLRIAILIHQDALNVLAALQPLLDGRSSKWIRLPPLNHNQALQAILEPLDALNWPVTLNRDLAERYIVTDLSANYPGDEGQPTNQWVDPGQLQITCTWLYDQARQKRPPVIDEKLYLDEAGGVDGILVRYLEEELQTRFADRFEIAKRALIALASPEMPRWVSPAQILASPLFSDLEEDLSKADAESLTQLLDDFVNAELLSRQAREGSIVYAFSSHTIADEARRIASETIQQAYAAGDELERVWRIWLANQVKNRGNSRELDGSLASREQYLLLSENAASLDARPIKYLLMLRSAAHHQLEPQPWMRLLRSKENGVRLLHLVDQPDPSAGKMAIPPSAVDLAGKLLGVNRTDLPKPPAAGIGRLAWAAVHSPNPTDRAASALALAARSAPESPLLPALEPALAALPSPVRRHLRRAELTALLADSGELPPASLSHLPLSQKSGAYMWRVWRRFLRNRRWIGWVTAGAGIGAALGLGVERLLVGALSESSVVANAGLGRIFFALFSYWGLLLGTFTAGFVVLRPILALADASASRVVQRRLSTILLGGVGFALANLLVAVLNNLNLAKAPGLLPAGVLAGAALAGSLCLSGQRFTSRLLVSLLSAGMFALVQAFFELSPPAGSGISVALSSALIEVEFDYFPAIFWQNWIQSTPQWASILAIIEGGLAGLALTLGASSGFTAANNAYQRWGKYWDLTGS